MNSQNPIGILDSGVGGLTVMKVVREILPGENIIYFGDSKNMPYGNKTSEEIVALSKKMIDFLLKYNVKAILLACNTISSNVASLNAPCVLFSIVDSGAKYALELGENEPIGIIATKATVKSGSYEKAIKNLLPTAKVISNDSASLPKIINNDMKNRSRLNASVKECIDPILQKDPKIKKLVLGCSHFPIISPEIKELYPSLTLMDPGEIMARDLKKYLEENSLKNENENGKTLLYTTADTFEFAAAIERLKLDIDKLEKISL